jgi:hypothetical protein
MMFRRVAFAFLSFHLMLSFAHGANYMIVKIADTMTSAPTGSFSNFQNPAISGSTVAFYGAFNGSQGIFTGSGGALTTVAKVGDVFPSGTVVTFKDNAVVSIAPSISGNTVAFWCGVRDNSNNFISSIHTSSGGVVSSAAQAGGPAPTGTYNGVTGLELPAIDGDTVAFWASYNNVNSGVVANIGGTPVSIVRYGDPAPVGTFNPGGFAGLNLSVSGNTVAFWSFFNENNDEGIFKGNGGAITTIAKTGDLAPLGTFTGFYTCDISDESVAFLGFYSSRTGVFIGSGGPLTEIIASGDAAPIGTFNSFTSCSYDGDTVAFLSSYNAGNGYGIFTMTDNVLQTIVKKGDPLFGSTVADLWFSTAGLDPDGSGNIAFVYDLSDGRRGIAMAIVPEPSCLVIMAAIGFCIIGRKRAAYQHKE